jgi:hypothetical protein
MHGADYCRIPLRARDGSIRAYTLVNPDDFTWLARHPWHLVVSHSGICYAYGGPEGGGMHRLLLGLQRGDPREGDHVDGDGLNNRRSNLRVVDHRMNRENHHLRRENVGHSQYRGVTRNGSEQSARPWIAFASPGDRFIGLGRYANELDAAAAAAQWRHANMPGTIEDPELLARVVPHRPVHPNIQRYHARAQEVERRWKAGDSLKEIAAGLCCSVSAVGAMMVRMRDDGYDLPFRAPYRAKPRA